MKKLVFGFGLAVAMTAGFTSCEKAASCYTCTWDNSGTTITYEICDDEVTTTTGGVSSTTAIPGGASKDDYKTTLEASGATCN